MGNVLVTKQVAMSLFEAKTDSCEPEDTLRCSKAVLKVRGEVSWLPGAPELEPVAHERLFWA